MEIYRPSIPLQFKPPYVDISNKRLWSYIRDLVNRTKGGVFVRWEGFRWEEKTDIVRDRLYSVSVIRRFIKKQLIETTIHKIFLV